MNIKLIKEEIKNFKGTKELDINFNDGITNISGPNASGKTSIYDAYLWCLFGKDSNDKKDFEVQPLDKNNNKIHHLETSVKITFFIDGIEKTFTRTLKEKWVKGKGEIEEKLSGTVSGYYINDVPVKLKDYNSEIENIINIDIFKLVSNPFYFTSLNWKDQRDILFGIAGNIEDKEVISFDKELDRISEMLGNGTVDDLKKRTKFEISKLKKDRETIKPRIDELFKSKSNLDFEGLEAEKEQLIKESNEIDLKIADVSKANEGKIILQDKLAEKKAEYYARLGEAKGDMQEELFNLKAEYRNKMEELKNNASKPLLEAKKSLKKFEYELSDLSCEIEDKIKKVNKLNSDRDIKTVNINKLQIKLDDLREEYNSISNKDFVFNDTLCKCPECGREYDNIEEIKNNALENFNKRKELLLKENIDKGIRLKKDLETIDKEVEEINNKEIALVDNINLMNLSYDELKDKINELKYTIEIHKKDTNNTDFEGKKELEKAIAELNIKITEGLFEGKEELEKEIEDIKESIKNFNAADTKELEEDKKLLVSKIDDINKKLAAKDINNKIDERIKELEEYEKELSVKIADLEGVEYLTEKFTRSKSKLLEEKINSKFGSIKFKLFNTLVNGGIEECCIVLINGVPYNSANTAAKINAGLEIIKSLSDYYKIVCPVFVDNAESVNNVKEIEGQIVKLSVIEGAGLKIE